jgi:hypothetical protein
MTLSKMTLSITLKNDTQPNNIKHNCTQDINKTMTLSKMGHSTTIKQMTLNHNDTQHNKKA